MLLSTRSGTIVDVAVDTLSPSSITARNYSPDGLKRDLAQGPRITYSAVSIFCMLLLATMLGSRLHAITDKHEKSLSFIRVLVFLLYFFAIAFVATTAILQSGLDLRTVPSCRAAIYVCLVFYFGSKVLVQLFLVERAHAVRYRLKRRRHDWVWLAFVAIIILGFGSIAGLAFAYPIADLADDQRCRIGLPTNVTLPLLVYDILINVGLTGVFITLLRPLLAFRKLRKIPDIHPNYDHGIFNIEGPRLQDCDRSPSTESSVELANSIGPTTHHTSADPNVNTLKLLVYKSLGGAVAMLIPTIINLGLLFRWEGHEQGWLCFTLCTLDVTWSVAVLHYLTVDHRDETLSS